MAFKLNRSSKEPMSEINVTPFVDVMLVLLIIFMVTAPLLTVGVQVDLPESSADSLPEETEPLTLSINAKGEIFIQESKVEYDKILPLKDQYCFIKVEIKELDNGEIVKQEVVECADGRKAYDGPSYWELFAQFYYRDMFTPAYCRNYERPKHAYHKPGKVCLDKDGNWEVRK